MMQWSTLYLKTLPIPVEVIMSVRFESYATICKHVQKKPKTFQELAKLCNRPARFQFRQTIRLLHSFGILYIAGFQKNSFGSWSRMYALGNLPDENYPGGGHPWAVEQPPHPVRLVELFAEMWKALKTPMCMLDLADHTGIDITCVQRFVSSLAKMRMLYVYEWERSRGLNERGRWVAVWAHRTNEHQRDAIKPDPIPRIERVRKCAANKKARLMSNSIFNLGASYAIPETSL